MSTYAIPGLTNLTYAETMEWFSDKFNISSEQIDAWCVEAAKYDVSDVQAFEDFMSMGNKVTFTKTANGNYNILGYDLEMAYEYSSPVNSNVSTVSRSTTQTMLNRGVTSSGKWNITRFPASGSFAQKASYVVGSVGSAVTAVSAGISLGKTVDSLLYNANPDFWDSLGMQTLNPATWSSLTTGDGSWQAGLFNWIFGLDPETGNTQAYMDANALAYMAMVLNGAGFFNSGQSGYVPPTGVTLPQLNAGNYNVPISFNDIVQYSTPGTLKYKWVCHDGVIIAVIKEGTNIVNLYLTSSNPNATADKYESIDNFATQELISSRSVTQYSKNYGSGSKTIYLKSLDDVYITRLEQGFNIINCSSNSDYYAICEESAYIYKYGTEETSPAVPGVDTQQGATVPDTTGWDTPANTLSSLQQQYPDMFSNALTWDNVQPDGTNPQLVYVPVPMPSISSYDDTKPTIGTETQAQPTINPTVTPDALIQELMKIIQQPQTDPDTDISQPPINPVDTGEGSSPTPVPTGGSASALWSVYHPTQAQVDSFGAWLWGSPFLTNIGKLFQNPIEGVITLHKIFVTPVDGTAQNIVVGTLDSGVSSLTVTEQYVYVDCGSINCFEVFGNVFDYSPHTSVSLYLPFIGIVPLDVNDVMRSTISITYGVDVFTGACLAMVNVTRDSFTVNMYQYTGVCSVEYPLSNVQNAQMVSGLLAIAGGVASMVMTGGVTAPAALGIAGGMTAASKSNVGRSGGFSGNAGAMGIKKPYLIIQRPQTKLANKFPDIEGFPTNVSGKLNDFSGQVIVKSVHVENIPATEQELTQIEVLLKSGVLI